MIPNTGHGLMSQKVGHQKIPWPRLKGATAVAQMPQGQNSFVPSGPCRHQTLPMLGDISRYAIHPRMYAIMQKMPAYLNISYTLPIII